MMFSEQERNAFARHEKEQRLFEASQPFIVRLTMLENMQQLAMILTKENMSGIKTTTGVDVTLPPTNKDRE